jgi:hypothetical protein
MCQKYNSELLGGGLTDDSLANVSKVYAELVAADAIQENAKKLRTIATEARDEAESALREEVFKMRKFAAARFVNDKAKLNEFTSVLRNHDKKKPTSEPTATPSKAARRKQIALASVCSCSLGVTVRLGCLIRQGGWRTHALLVPPWRDTVCLGCAIPPEVTCCAHMRLWSRLGGMRFAWKLRCTRGRSSNAHIPPRRTMHAPPEGKTKKAPFPVGGELSLTELVEGLGFESKIPPRRDYEFANYQYNQSLGGTHSNAKSLIETVGNHD